MFSLVASTLVAADTPSAASTAPGDICIFAAASTTESLSELAKTWESTHQQKVVCSFGASTTLAHQIQSGAPADLFLAADEASMDVLAASHDIQDSTRRDLLGNHLVLVAPTGSDLTVRFTRDFNFSTAFTGKIAIGDPAHVPAGTYAKEALTTLGWWDQVKDRTAPADNVRAALRLVETQVCALGVVYATDAAASTKIVTIGAFPDDTHQPILYPIAETAHARPHAAAFAAWLAGDEAAEIFTAHHFVHLTASATASATAPAAAGGH
jgi:molybdate transport system substrate-binding protein